MVASAQDSGLFGKLRKLVSPKIPSPPEPTPLSLEEILNLAPLSETHRKAIIRGAVKRGITDKPEYLASVLEEMQKDDGVGVYNCAMFAAQHGMRQIAVEIYTANKLYGDAISALFDVGELEQAMELFPLLSESKGFFSKGKLYERAAEWSSIYFRDEERTKSLKELALSAHQEYSRWEEGGKLAERWKMPERAIAAYVAGAEKDTHNALFYYRNAARVAKDSNDAADAEKYLRQAADALIGDTRFNSLNANDILRLGEEINDPAIIQKAYELSHDYIHAGDIAEKRRGDIESAIGNYLKANRLDLAVGCALSHNLPERAVSIYRKNDMLNEGLQLALEHGIIIEAKEIAQTIITGYGDKIHGYRALEKLSAPDEANRISLEAELHFAREGRFKEAAEFSQDETRKNAYLILAERCGYLNKSVQ